MALYRDTGVVLRSYKLGEADRIIVFFTRGRGKVRAVAKGVRRTKSKFGARLEAASIVDLQLYDGRNLDIVTQVERKSVLSSMRSDLAVYGRASTLLEIVDACTEDSQSNPAMYKLLVGALEELDRSGNVLVLPAFVMKLLALEGVQPLVSCCVRCGSDSNLATIQIHEGGVLCSQCSVGEPISQATIEALQMLLSGRVRFVLDSAPQEVAHELELLATRLIEQHLEKPLRTAKVASGDFSA